MHLFILNLLVHGKTYNKFCKNFREVVELTTTPNQSNLFDSWIGEYCNYIKILNHKTCL